MIIPGSGNETVLKMYNCVGDLCYHTFLSDNITDSYSVAVKVVGCVITRNNCTNTSSGE